MLTATHTTIEHEFDLLERDFYSLQDRVDSAFQARDTTRARKAALEVLAFLKRKEDLYKGNVDIEDEKFQACVNKMYATHFIGAIDSIDRGTPWEESYWMGLGLMFPSAFKP